MEATLFTRALETAKHIRSEEAIILTKPFLDLCTHLLPLVDSFGSCMSCIKTDITSNIVKLESKYESNPSKYRTLYAITKEEVEAQTARNSLSCTSAFVWLNRAMDFLVQLFRNLLEHPEWTMKQVCTDSYKKTLKKWHGWLAFSTFKVIMKFAPPKQKFMETAGVNPDSRLDIEKLCTAFAPMLEDNHKFLANNGVDDFKAP